MWDALHDLIPLYNLKNLKNTHGGSLLLVKESLLHGRFSRLSNCTNSTKSRKASHMKFDLYFTREKKIQIDLPLWDTNYKVGIIAEKPRIYKT